VTSLLPRRGFLLSNPFSGADGASPSNFCGGRGLPFETRSGFRYERDLGSWARGQSRVFTCFGLEGRGVSPAYSLVLDSKGAVDFCSQTLSPAPTERRPPTFGWGRGLPFETRSGFRCERGGRGVSPAYLHVLDSKGAMDFCSQTLSPAPTERRPPTFGWGRGLPFETRSGFRYERGGRGVSPAYSLVLDSKGAVDFCSQTLSPAPTERRPPTFGGRGLPFETRSGFRYERDLGS
jgi:hypothetical protein